MKRLLIVAILALAAGAATATPCLAFGSFGLFYCPKHCASYCQVAGPYNAFSPGGGCGGCCPQPCCAPHHGCCGPHAMHMVHPTNHPLGPIEYGGMDSFGLGGLTGGCHGCSKGKCGKGKRCCGGRKCKGGACVGESYAGGYEDIGGPMVYPYPHSYAPGVPAPGPVAAPAAAPANGQTAPPPPAPAVTTPTPVAPANRMLALYRTANMTPQQAAANYTQPVSYQGYYPGYNYPVAPMANGYGYGYYYHPGYAMPMYNPAMWMQYGYPQGW